MPKYDDSGTDERYDKWEEMIMRRILLVLFFVATGILCAQSDETYEEILSRYLGRIEVVDGTNVLVQAREWGGGLLVKCDGWTSYYPIDMGEEKILHCGENISFRYCGGPSLDIQLFPGVWTGDHHDLSSDEEEGVTVRIREGKRMDVCILPKESKGYDALVGRYIDLRFPFKNMWKDLADMAHYRKRMMHRGFSERTLERSVKYYAYMKNYLTTNNQEIVSTNVSGPRIVTLKLNSRVEMEASLSVDGNINGILIKTNEVMWKAYTYSDCGCPDEYVELDGKALSAVVKYSKDGTLLKSWHSNYNPQYVVVSNGVLVSGFEIKDRSGYVHSVARHINELFMGVRGCDSKKSK